MTELASALECSRITIKRWAAFWVSAGILREGAGGEVLVVAASDEDVGLETGTEEPLDEVDEEEEDMPKPSKQMETKYQVRTSVRAFSLPTSIDPYRPHASDSLLHVFLRFIGASSEVC